ncbi:hypothetical protein [uncultured Bacteroides sp.]|uniref:hypothetical protein n=1 Tax=uncultured Bacteroides sp. TaxID=162156 RepID=UPI002605F2CA|nr:hypothetical protein [uncultured Bacteroides sp.]
MKTKLLLGAFILSLGLGTVSCIGPCYTSKHPHHKEKRIPPGQKKKMRGEKSAKYDAPGHHKHKKHHHHDDD